MDHATLLPPARMEGRVARHNSTPIAGREISSDFYVFGSGGILRSAGEWDLYRAYLGSLIHLKCMAGRSIWVCFSMCRISDGAIIRGDARINAPNSDSASSQA